MSPAAWTLYALWTGALLTAAAWVADRAGALLGRSTRWLWLAAGCGTVTLPVLVLVWPVVREGPVFSLVPQWHWPALDGAGGRPESNPAANSDGPPAKPLGRHRAQLIWALLSGATLSWMLLSHRRLARVRRSWRRAVLGGHTVAISRDLGPAVVGVLRPEIVLPEWVAELTPSELDLVLRHEAEHLTRHDPRLLALLAACIALMPWQPFLWLQLAGLRQAIELDCDRRVLRRAPRRAYAELLLALAERCWRSGVAAGWGLSLVTRWSRPSQLERRLRAMTRATLSLPERLGALTMLVWSTIVAGVACVTPPPEPPRTHPEPFDRAVWEQASADSMTATLAQYFPIPTRRLRSDSLEVYWLVSDLDGRMIRYGKGGREIIWRSGKYYRDYMPAMFRREQARADSLGQPGPARDGVYILDYRSIFRRFPDLEGRTLSSAGLGSFAFGADSVMVAWGKLEVGP